MNNLIVSQIMKTVINKHHADFEKMNSEILCGVSVNDFVGGGKPEEIVLNWLELFLAARG